jgi:outer membrane PBP1 activator LpoA protein
MSDSPDELILKMQHLEAQAKETLKARGMRDGLDRLKSSAQKLAWNMQAEVSTLEKQQQEAEDLMEKLRVGGVTGDEAVEYVTARAKAEQAKKELVRARAKLNFALDQMSEVDRREYEAFHAEVRAETHGQMAEDPLFNKG